jgi:hypothetical protein
MSQARLGIDAGGPPTQSHVDPCVPFTDGTPRASCWSEAVNKLPPYENLTVRFSRCVDLGHISESFAAEDGSCWRCAGNVLFASMPLPRGTRAGVPINKALLREATLIIKAGSQSAPDVPHVARSTF